jgi:hypothetical protein
MARGTQLSALVYMLRAEIRRSTDVSIGTADLPELKQVLNRHYDALWWKYDWPHLCKYFPQVTLNAGQQLYDFPSGLTYERIKSVYAWWSGSPTRIDRGIDFDNYATFNSLIGSRSDPPMAWDVRYNDGVTEALEIWPIPATTGNLIQFFGYATLPRLVADADRCLLDDMLVVLSASADILAGAGAKGAAIRLREAQDHEARLIGKTDNNSRMTTIGLGEANGRREFSVHPTYSGSGTGTVPVVPGTNTSPVTQRQFRTALSLAGVIHLVQESIPSDISNAVNIEWLSGAPVTPGDTLALWTQGVLGYSNAQMTSLFDAARLTTP